MRYVYGAVIPALLQALFVYIVIQMNTGNGSWVGLGALLLGMFVIPATAIVNSLYIKANEEKSAAQVLLKCFLITLIMPFIIFILLMVG